MHYTKKMEALETFNLYPYQQDTLLSLFEKKRSLCALDMGLGKTFVALGLAIAWEWNQLIIVTPKSKLRKVSPTDDSWENMVQKYLWTEFKIPKKIDEEYIKSSPIVVINYEMFKKFNFKPKGTYIFDEIQKAKSPKSQVGKAVFFQSYTADRVLLLSGDPYPQGYIDSFNLMRILTNQNIKHSWFVKRYCNYDYNAPWPRLIGYKREQELIEFFHEYGIWLKTADVIGLPEQKFINIEYDPPREFKEMLNYKMFRTSDEPVVAPHPLTRLTLLRELSGGIYKWDEQWHTLKSNPKLEKTLEIIESTNHKIVIYYNFNGEKDSLIKVIKDKVFIINGQINQKEEFINYPHKAILLAQYQSASSAIDGLQNATNIIVCYSPTFSGENWKQMLKRIHRIGQNNTCYYYLLQNKLEADIYAKIKVLENYTLEAFNEKWNKEKTTYYSIK